MALVFGAGNRYRLLIPSNLYANGEHIRLEVNGVSDVLPKRNNTFLASKQSSEDLSLDAFQKRVGMIKEDIERGRFMQCVLSRKVGIGQQHPTFEVYKQLREINPSPYCFHFDFGNEQLFGASPELHLRMEENIAQIRPIAGTIRREKDPVRDFEQRVKLQTDPKELSEHAMLVDLARNDLYIHALPQSVQVDEFARVEEYPNLYHLVSGVSGTIKNADAIDVLLATLPAGTLSGAPKREAMRAIEALEGSQRGYYGGAIGYVTTRGCNTGITIRSCHTYGGMHYVRSGAGIVRDSTPEGETAEIMLKAQKMITLLGGAL